MKNILLTAEVAAKELLGMQLVYETVRGRVAGKIVETEAYTQIDPASHSFRGQTKRNAPMFGPPGTIYIYFTYGMHHCLNIVTGPEGKGEAVLIRGLEPIEGLEIMRSNRLGRPDEELTNGPAKLVQALGVDSKLNGQQLGKLLILEPGEAPQTIIETTRIGIKNGAEIKWRFYVAGNPFVSRT